MDDSRTLTEYLEHLDELGQRVGGRLRDKYLRDRAWRGLVSSIRELLQRAFRGIESIRSADPAANDGVALAETIDPATRRTLYILEHHLDHAEQLLDEVLAGASGPRDAPLRRPQLRYFELVHLRMREIVTVRCMAQRYVMGHNADTAAGYAATVDARAQKLLDVLATDNSKEDSKLEIREFNARLLPDYFDLELIKRKKKGKKKRNLH